MLVIDLILLTIAAFCFAWVAITERALLAIGLLVWVAVPLFHTIDALIN